MTLPSKSIDPNALRTAALDAAAQEADAAERGGWMTTPVAAIVAAFLGALLDDDEAMERLWEFRNSRGKLTNEEWARAALAAAVTEEGSDATS